MPTRLKLLLSAKPEVAHMEQLWVKLAEVIKENLQEQCQVICPNAYFSEVRLDKIVINGRIKVASDEDDESPEDPETDPVNPTSDP